MSLDSLGGTGGAHFFSGIGEGIRDTGKAFIEKFTKPSSQEDVKDKLDRGSSEGMKGGTERVGKFLSEGTQSAAGYGLMGMALVKTPFSESMMKTGLGLRGKEIKSPGQEASYRRENIGPAFKKMWYGSVVYMADKMNQGARSVALSSHVKEGDILDKGSSFVQKKSQDVRVEAWLKKNYAKTDMGASKLYHKRNP